jgi:methionyl-tRNA synthetase
MSESTENKPARSSYANSVAGGPFYITTTLPYVNGKPHVGYALEIIQADVIARFHRLAGDEVVFNVGTDEHGQKIYQKAAELGKTPQEYCDEMAEHFRALRDMLGVSFTNFIRTTDAHHIAAAQEFWKRCADNGDIYKKQYQVKYCVGCELEKTDSDLDHGKCPDHPNMELTLIDEENYFFRFSKYQQPLLDLYATRPDFVVPSNRLVEIKNFVEKGLQDFSISRVREKMPWGIPVPGDDTQVMYVWFDALANYITTLGWPENEADFAKFWPGVQIAGKDNLRQQSAMWQAMLLSAGLEPSRQILIHGHILTAGQKMSKSLDNVIAPEELTEKFGADGTRYLLLVSGNLESDIDITMERLTEQYNAHLANGLGNLVSRVMKLSEKVSQQSAENLPTGQAGSQQEAGSSENEQALLNEVAMLIGQYHFADALSKIWEVVREANKFIDEEKPWELVKTDQARFDAVMRQLLSNLALIEVALQPLLPETAAKINQALETGKAEPLFQRIA